MTDRRRPKLPRRPRPVAVAASSLALFFTIFTFLALQMRAGRDPALGATQATRTAAPRTVIVRRVVVTKRHIVIVHDDDASTPAPRTTRTSAPAQNSAPAQTSAPAPVQPQPAPQPTPVVTRTS